MAKRKSNELLVFGLISVVIVVAVFAAVMSTPSGHFSKESTAPSSTGAVFRCAQANTFNWMAEYTNGDIWLLKGQKELSSSDVGCNPNLWFCYSGSERLKSDEPIPCKQQYKNAYCMCRGQNTVLVAGLYSTSN